jgi:hypothetical protein
VDRVIEWAQELPKNRSGGVTQNRTVAAGEDRGHEAPVEAQATVADGVDALVDSVEMTIARRLGDRVLAHTHLTKLARGDDAVLSRGGSCEARRGGVAFFPHGWE